MPTPTRHAPFYLEAPEGAKFTKDQLLDHEWHATYMTQQLMFEAALRLVRRYGEPVVLSEAKWRATDVYKDRCDVRICKVGP